VPTQILAQFTFGKLLLLARALLQTQILCIDSGDPVYLGLKIIEDFCTAVLEVLPLSDQKVVTNLDQGKFVERLSETQKNFGRSRL